MAELTGVVSQRGPARAALAGWAVLAILLLFCGAMTRPVTYDEDQYVAAGVMALHGLPYRDFVYLQPPLYPYVLAPLFALTGGWFLLTSRLLSFGLAVMSGGLLWHLVRRLGAGPGLAALLVTACLASPFLLAPLANARNDGLPLMLLLAGLAVHLWAVDHRRPARWPWLGQALAALLFGLAAEAKLSYLFAPAVLGVATLGAPRRLPPVVLGLGVAALPAVLFWMVAPEAFWFGLVGYHLIAPADWYGRAGLGGSMTFLARLEALADYASIGGSLTLVVLAATLSMVAMARRRKWKRPGLLLLALTLGAAVLAFLPSPSWAMYYAAVAPLLACCIAHLDRVTTNLAGAARKRILAGVAALPIVPFLVLQLAELPWLLDGSRWVGIQAHRSALTIRAAAGGGVVATLFPIAVLDANPIRPDLASGPFVFRSGGAFDAGRLARLHALSPAALEEAFGRDPPAAIYTGLFADAWAAPMDAPLADYAERHGWRSVAVGGLAGGQAGRLWLRP